MHAVVVTVCMYVRERKYKALNNGRQWITNYIHTTRFALKLYCCALSAFYSFFYYSVCRCKCDVVAGKMDSFLTEKITMSGGFGWWKHFCIWFSLCFGVLMCSVNVRNSVCRVIGKCWIRDGMCFCIQFANNALIRLVLDQEDKRTFQICIYVWIIIDWSAE